MCERCEELREENLYLRRQLGLEVDAGKAVLLRERLGVTPTMAAMMLALLNVYPRPLGWQALDALVPESLCDERIDPRNQTTIRIFQIRKRVGADTIKTHWGQGWALSEAGAQRVSEALQAVAA